MLAEGWAALERYNGRFDRKNLLPNNETKSMFNFQIFYDFTVVPRFFKSVFAG